MRLYRSTNPFPLRTLLSGVLVVLLLVGLSGYVLYQARFLVWGPQITLTKTPQTVQHQRVVPLTGQMVNIVEATLNGRSLFTDERGNFEEALVLENGYTIATLRATDRYGRTTTVTLPFVFVPQSVVTN